MSYYDRDYYKPSGFGGFSFFPPVIKNLLIINGVLFILLMMMDRLVVDGVPAEYIITKWFALMPLGSGYFEIWQLITYQFLHGGFSHIFFNMLSLWMFGAEIENIWGSKKFLIFYLLCGVGAGLLHLFLSPILIGSGAPTVGASGAIYGIMVAFAMMFPNRLIMIYFLIPVKAKYLITFMIVVEFMAVDSAGSGIAHLAHLGGAIVGFVFILLDKNTNVALKNIFEKINSTRSYSNTNYNPFSKKTIFKNEPDIQDANYSDVYEKENKITQDDIDRILDKISQSGYSKLTEKEKKVLFEASKRMK